MKLPRRLPPPNWLLAFEAAARHLSFTEAARELHLTQSAVSQQVKLLEHALQAPLFHRHARRLELTEAGRSYLPVVHDAFQRLTRATEELFDPGAAALLVLKTNVSFAVCWLAPRLARFWENYPGVALRLSQSVWLDEQGWDAVDLDIRAGRGDWPALTAEPLTREALFPVCAPAVAARLGAPADLAAETLLAPVGNTDGWPQWLQRVGCGNLQAARTVQLDSSVTAFELAAHGAGVALGRSSLAAGMLADGRLVCPFETAVDSDEGFYLVYPRARRLRPAALAFREWLLAECR